MAGGHEAALDAEPGCTLGPMQGSCIVYVGFRGVCMNLISGVARRRLAGDDIHFEPGGLERKSRN